MLPLDACCAVAVPILSIECMPFSKIELELMVISVWLSVADGPWQVHAFSLRRRRANIHVSFVHASDICFYVCDNIICDARQFLCGDINVKFVFAILIDKCAWYLHVVARESLVKPVMVWSPLLNRISFPLIYGMFHPPPPSLKLRLLVWKTHLCLLACLPLRWLFLC